MTARTARTGEHGIEDLSEREHQILELVANGLTNKEIADQLFLSEKTVKHYMTSILEKLQVRNRVEAALLARERHKK
jgi:two-component system nitrate/nitrite response regulator NarL